MKKYRLVEVVGDGTYGTVWKGIYLETGEKVAIKKLKTKIKTWQECIELKEVKALSKLKTHYNVIKLKEVIRETNSEVYFVFEYADTNLYDYIDSIKKKGEKLSESKVKEIIFQIANGLNYIHMNGYFHRDMKPENILLIKDGIDIRIKIADFGLAKEIPTFYNNIAMTDYVCTRWYRSPECILKSTNYSSSMDVWALGCIMAELLMLNPIFPGTSEIDQLTTIINVIGTPKLNDWPEGYKLIQKLGMKFPGSSGVHISNLIPNLSQQGIKFLYELLNWDPLLRPTCAKILSNSYFDEVRHKFFSDFNGIYHSTNNQSSSNLSINNTINSNSNLNLLNFQTNKYNTPENASLAINSGNYYYKNLNTNNDEYLNNFNYKAYRSNNNYIPEMTMLYPSNIYGNSNLGNNYINKSKLSNLAENDMKFNKYKGNLITNNHNYGSYVYDVHPSNSLGVKHDFLNGKDSNINLYDMGVTVGNSNLSTNNNKGIGDFSSKKLNYKSDLENQLNVINNSQYSNCNLFNYPQIYI
jgi:serine/threonine protein kinase